MRKLVIIIFLSLMYIETNFTLKASTILQKTPIPEQNCFIDFFGCMNDAEIKYSSTVGAIQDSEEKAQKIYVAALQACLSSYSNCPQ